MCCMFECASVQCSHISVRPLTYELLDLRRWVLFSETRLASLRHLFVHMMSQCKLQQDVWDLNMCESAHQCVGGWVGGWMVGVLVCVCVCTQTSPKEFAMT